LENYLRSSVCILFEDHWTRGAETVDKSTSGQMHVTFPGAKI